MKYLFLALSAVLIFAACNKTPTPSLTRLDMLRSGRWKLSSGTLVVKQPNGNDTTLNYLNFLPSCYAGSYIVFSNSTVGEVYTGSEKCLPSNPDSVQFQWGLSNNYNNISFYRGFTLVWSVIETINPISFDTLSHSPLELDSIHSYSDTLLLGYTGFVPVLDSTWNLTYTRDSVPTFSIDNAVFTSFSATAFTIYFTMISTFPDSINHHEGYGFFPTGSGTNDTTDLPPVITPDTFQYTLTYTNF